MDLRPAPYPTLLIRGKPHIHPPHRILDAIFYIVSSGCTWRYLPGDFSPW